MVSFWSFWSWQEGYPRSDSRSRIRDWWGIAASLTSASRKDLGQEELFSLLACKRQVRYIGRLPPDTILRVPMNLNQVRQLLTRDQQMD